MILIRFAISLFALALIGLAMSLGAAESGQNDRPGRATTFIER